MFSGPHPGPTGPSVLRLSLGRCARVTDTRCVSSCVCSTRPLPRLSGHPVYLNLRLFLFQIWYTSYLVHFMFPYAHQTPFTNIKCIVFISVYFSTKWLHITAYPKWTFRERMAPGLVDRLNKKERNMGKESCRALLGSILVLS